MLKIFFSFLLLLLCSLVGFSQNSFEFFEDSHDFGVAEEFIENKGGVNPIWEFKFKNIGKDTIRLSKTDVRPGCGCTTPGVSTDPVPPGGTGGITAQYNSNGKIGPYIKKVTVSYKGEIIKELLIKGIIVKQDSVRKYSEAELKKSARFVPEKNSLILGKAEKGTVVITRISVKNIGKDTLKILSAPSACSCITSKLTSDKQDKKYSDAMYVLPGKPAVLELYYTTSPTVGRNADVVTITTNDRTVPRVPITLYVDTIDPPANKTPTVDKKEEPFK